MNLNTEQKTFHVKYYATSTATYFWTYIVDIKFKKRKKKYNSGREIQQITNY